MTLHPWLFVASAILSSTQMSLGGVQIPNHVTVYACPYDRSELVGSVVATRSAITDVEAPILSHARFASGGRIIAVDRSGKRVLLLGEDLAVIRVIGREGGGPGEYRDPVAAVVNDDGRVFVADAAGPSMIVYQDDGGFVREDPLPVDFSPYDLAANGVFTYAAGRVMFTTIPSPSRPVVVEYDPTTGGNRVLLQQTPEWFGEPPVYRNSVVELIPRVGPQGNLYIGFKQGNEIWRIIGPDEYEVAVRGCVPEGALQAFRRDDEGASTTLPTPSGTLSLRPPRASYNLLGDFVVLPGERILSRGVLYIDEGGKRSLDLFSASEDGGELLESWSLGPARVVGAWTTMNPNDPTQHLSWASYDGTTHLLRFPNIGHATHSGRTMDDRLTSVALSIFIIVCGMLLLIWLAFSGQRNSRLRNRMKTH